MSEFTGKWLAEVGRSYERGYDDGIELAKQTAVQLIDECAAMDGLKCWLRGPVEFRNALVARLGQKGASMDEKHHGKPAPPRKPQPKKPPKY